jgi:hypothetical protein
MTLKDLLIKANSLTHLGSSYKCHHHHHCHALSRLTNYYALLWLIVNIIIAFKLAFLHDRRGGVLSFSSSSNATQPGAFQSLLNQPFRVYSMCVASFCLCFILKSRSNLSSFLGAFCRILLCNLKCLFTAGLFCSPIIL